MLEWIFPKHAPIDSHWGRMTWIGSKNPHPFNRQFIYLDRGEKALIGHIIQEVQTFMGPDTALQTFEIWRRTRLAMPKTILRARLIVIEAWFGGY